jgi:hypothetical protein
VTAAEWSATVIERGRAVGPLPRFGSDEWAKLAPNSPQAVASVVVAAICWLDYTDPATVHRDLELELLAMRQVENRRAAEDFAALARFVRRSANSPTQVELQARRLAVAS